MAVQIIPQNPIQDQGNQVSNQPEPYKLNTEWDEAFSEMQRVPRTHKWYRISLNPHQSLFLYATITACVLAIFASLAISAFLVPHLAGVSTALFYTSVACTGLVNTFSLISGIVNHYISRSKLKNLQDNSTEIRKEELFEKLSHHQEILDTKKEIKLTGLLIASAVTSLVLTILAAVALHLATSPVLFYVGIGACVAFNLGAILKMVSFAILGSGLSLNDKKIYSDKLRLIGHPGNTANSLYSDLSDIIFHLNDAKSLKEITIIRNEIEKIYDNKSFKWPEIKNEVNKKAKAYYSLEQTFLYLQEKLKDIDKNQYTAFLKIFSDIKDLIDFHNTHAIKFLQLFEEAKKQFEIVRNSPILVREDVVELFSLLNKIKDYKRLISNVHEKISDDYQDLQKKLEPFVKFTDKKTKKSEEKDPLRKELFSKKDNDIVLQT